MLSQKDYIQIKQRGSNPDVVLKQIDNFKKGFPFYSACRFCNCGKRDNQSGQSNGC